MMKRLQCLHSHSLRSVIGMSVGPRRIGKRFNRVLQASFH
jgi:hypothetical protein